MLLIFITVFLGHTGNKWGSVITMEPINHAFNSPLAKHITPLYKRSEVQYSAPVILSSSAFPFFEYELSLYQII